MVFKAKRLVFILHPVFDITSRTGLGATVRICCSYRRQNRKTQFSSGPLIFDNAGCSYTIHGINGEVTDARSLSIFHEEDTKHYPINGLTSNFQESRYTSDYFVSKYSSHSIAVRSTGL